MAALYDLREELTALLRQGLPDAAVTGEYPGEGRRYPQTVPAVAVGIAEAALQKLDYLGEQDAGEQSGRRWETRFQLELSAPRRSGAGELYRLFDQVSGLLLTYGSRHGLQEVDCGRAEYIRLEHAMEQMDVIRASASMPFVSKPVKLGGKLYLDGGVADSIPFKAAEKLGFDRVVVILTRDRSYVKKPMASGPIEVWYKHYPAFMEQLKNRHSTYNNAVRELLNWEQQGKAWVLHPSLPIEIGRLERHADRLQAVYDLGTGDAKAALPALRTYLGQP